MGMRFGTWNVRNNVWGRFAQCSGGRNIKMDLREVGWDGMDWIHLAQDRDQWRALVNTVMNIRVP
jgi:hypothetical protein